MSEWISVKDRLPEELQNVLVIDARGALYLKTFESGIFYEGDTYCYSPVGQVHEPSHWMAAPEVPKDLELIKYPKPELKPDDRVLNEACQMLRNSMSGTADNILIEPEDPTHWMPLPEPPE